METLCGEGGDELCERLRDAVRSRFGVFDVTVGRTAPGVEVRWWDGPSLDQVRAVTASALARHDAGLPVTYRRALTPLVVTAAVVALHDRDPAAATDPIDLALVAAAAEACDLSALPAGLSPLLGLPSGQVVLAWASATTLLPAVAVPPLMLPTPDVAAVTTAVATVVTALQRMRRDAADG